MDNAKRALFFLFTKFHITLNESEISSSKFITTKYINNDTVDGKEILQ